MKKILMKTHFRTMMTYKSTEFEVPLARSLFLVKLLYVMKKMSARVDLRHMLIIISGVGARYIFKLHLA